MHLHKLPTWFVKGDERRAAYYTIQAREFRSAGFVEEGEKAIAKKPIERQPEILVEAGTTAYDSTEAPQEPLVEQGNLDSMTKAELLEYATDHGKELKSSLPKSEILDFCKGINHNL